MDSVKSLLVMFISPVAAFMQVGPTLHFWVNIVLTLLGSLPGMVQVLWVVVAKTLFLELFSIKVLSLMEVPFLL